MISEIVANFSTHLKMGWRNLGRNPKRTALIWTAVAVAQITLMWITSFMNGFQGVIFQKLTGPMLGHAQVHALKYRDDSEIERTLPHASLLIQKIKSASSVVQISPRVYAPVLSTAQELGHVALLTGLDISQEQAESGLLAGLDPTLIPGPQEALVGKGLADEMGLRVGDSLALMGQAVDGSIASGIYRIKGFIQTAVDQLNRTGIIVELSSAQEFLAMEDQVHELTLHMSSPELISQGIQGLKTIPELAALEILSWQELVPQLAVLLQMMEAVNFIIIVLVFLTTVSGIANTMLMATFERSHEFGMLLALGCRPKRLIQILLVESVILGLAGVLIGSVIGYAVIWRGVHMGYDLSAVRGSGPVASLSMEGISLGMTIFPVLKARDVLRGVIAVIVTSILASLWPARRISQLEPVEAMRS